MPRPSTTALAQAFTAGQMTKEELVALVFQPRRAPEGTSGLSSGDKAADFRAFIEEVRKGGQPEFADRLTEFADEAATILND